MNIGGKRAVITRVARLALSTPSQKHGPSPEETLLTLVPIHHFLYDGV